MYSESEVRESTLKYFSGDEMLTNIWIDKYCLKNTKGDYLEKSPLDMFGRLAKELSRIENKYQNPISYDEIYSLIKDFKYFILAGSPLFGIGNNDSIVSISNCFFLGNHGDSYSSILRTDQEAVQLYKRRGGVGIDISHLRPKNSPVTNSAGTSTGAVSFMERFSNSARETGQNGRRAALMISIDVNHPDVEDFITIKSDTSKITGANVSVKVDDNFMKAVDYARGLPLWQKLIHQTWNNAEPGLLYWSTIQKESPSDAYEDFKVQGVNPCSEIVLSDYECCRLGHMNLYSFVVNPFTDKAYFDYDSFKEKVAKSYRLMDNLVDLDIEKMDQILDKIEKDPEDASTKAIEKELWLNIKDKTIRGRRVGLGYTGMADAMAALGVKYGSKEGISFVGELTKQLALSTYKSSINLAKERGAFPEFNYHKEVDRPFIDRIYNELDEEWKCSYGDYGRRNITSLTVAPTGTTSLMAGNISSGIEPVYQLSYKRRRKVNEDNPNKSFQDKKGDWWEEYEVLHSKYKEYIGISGDMYNTESPYHGTTAYEITPEQKVRTIAAAQKWIDSAISNTLNFKENATEEEISDAAILAWKLGLKGFTCYRDNCRSGVLVSNNTKENTTFKTNNAPKRPKYVPCDIFTPTTHGQQYVVAVGIIENMPYEVFAFKFDGKFNLDKGYIKKVNRGRYDIVTLDKEVCSEDITSEMSQVEEDRTRLISWGLRHGGGIKFLVEQLGKAKGNGFQSFSRVIARTLKRYIKDNDAVSGATCDNCGSTDLVYKDGCQSCNSCGNSLC